MKKFIALVLLSGLAVVALPPLARATTTFPAGEYTATIIDRSSLFSNQDADAFLEPEVAGQSIDVGDEQRTIFKVNAIDTGVKLLLGNGTKTVVEGGDSIPYVSGLLTGMLYDLKIDRIMDHSTTPPTSVSTLTNPASGDAGPYNLEKGSAGRYLSSGGSDGTWTDTIGAAGDLVSDLANGVHYGGILVIYEDPALNLAFAGDGVGAVGPADWREPSDISGTSPHPGGGAMDVPGVLTNADYFPTISDVAGSNTLVADSGTAEPWLVLALVDLFDIPAHGLFPANPFGVAGNTFLLERSVLSAGQGIEVSGVAFGNVIGGTAASMFNLGNFSIFSDDGTVRWLADMRFEFEGENELASGGYDDWQIDSDDPAMFGVSVVPEPATMSLFGMALLSLPGLYYRRKRK